MNVRWFRDRLVSDPEPAHSSWASRLGLVLAVCFVACGGEIGAEGRDPVRGAGDTRRALVESVDSTPQPESAHEPTHVLSLGELQRRARASRRGRLAPELIELGGLRRIHGFSLSPDGDLLLYGDRAPERPPLHLDDFVVALRNAYHVSSEFAGEPGCSIDLWAGQEDPWKIQQVRIMGGPPSTRMARRHLALDYELKMVSAGLLVLSDRLVSVYDRLRPQNLCANENDDTERMADATHRFWFAPRYPERPRFAARGTMTLIRRSLGVQLMTEQEYLSSRGERVGAAEPDPTARAFAQDVTKVLTSGEVMPYEELRADFRWVELARLMRFRAVPPEALAYLLAEHRLENVEIPQFVTGIEREETTQAVCAGKVEEKSLPGGTSIRASTTRRVHGLRFIGGVQANVDIAAADVAEPNEGELETIANLEYAATPPSKPNTLIWGISYSSRRY